MIDDRIRDKIRHLIGLAKRPGTPQEGEAARLAAVRLCHKYGLTCEFTGVRPSTSAPPPNCTPQQHEASDNDAIFYRWIRNLAAYGWLIYECIDTKIGRQLRFRKPGWNSEIRVTQRKSGTDFEAEHIMRPDLDQLGRDLSYMSYMTISLNELLQHIAYTRDASNAHATASAN